MTGGGGRAARAGLADDARYVTRPGMMSPPFHEFNDIDLADGAPLTGPWFPVVAR